MSETEDSVLVCAEPAPPHAEIVPIAPAELARQRGSKASPAAMYLASLSTEPSRRTARQSMQRITRVFGYKGLSDWIHFPWEHLDYEATMFVRAKLIETHGPSTVRLTLTQLRMVLHFAFQQAFITHEQWARATTWPKVPGKSIERGRSMTDDELGTLRSYLDELPGAYGELMTAMFAAGLGGGLRREEISRLHHSALQPDDLLLVYGKGRKERKVSLLGGASDDIRRWMATRAKLGFRTENLLVSLWADGRHMDRPISPGAVAERVTDVFKAIGFKGLTTHDLRRTYATRALEVGDVFAVQHLMGHASPATTEKYDRRGEKAGIRVASQVYAWGKRPSESQNAAGE
jgi:integrase